MVAIVDAERTRDGALGDGGRQGLAELLRLAAGQTRGLEARDLGLRVRDLRVARREMVGHQDPHEEEEAETDHDCKLVFTRHD